MVRYARLWLVTLVCGGALACGGGDDDPPPPVDSGSDTGGDAGVDAPMSMPMTFGVHTVFFLRQTNQQDVPGVALFLDLTDGTRLEATTGADGRAAFDLSAEQAALFEGAAITGYLDEDHALVTVLDLGADALAALAARGSVDGEGDLLMGMGVPGTTPTFATVSGRATGLMDAAHNLAVISIVEPTRSYFQASASWSLEVPVDTPFGLLAMELSQPTGADVTVGDQGREAILHQFVEVTSDGVSADGTIDIDFATATALTPETLTVTWPHPTEGEVFRTGVAGVVVVDATTSALVGFDTRTDIDEGGATVTGAVSYVRPEGVDRFRTSLTYDDRPLFSRVLLDGLAMGDVEVTFLDAPRVLSPDFGVDATLDGEITFRSDENGTTLVLVTDDDTDEVVWSVLVPPGGLRARFPEVPGVVNADTFFSGASYEGRVYSCSDISLGYCQAFSGGRAFGVIIP